MGSPALVSGLSTGTVDGTEDRDSVEVPHGLEGVDPRQRKMSTRVLDIGLCMSLGGSVMKGSSIQMMGFP